MIKVCRTVHQVWEFARQVLGDTAYERYAECIQRKGQKPLPPGEFYLAQLKHKYSRPSRCC